MNRSDLIAKLAERSKITHADAEAVVALICDKMVESMRAGHRIEIRGFGSFMVKSYKGYEGRNPKTGVRIPVPPKKLPFFKVGKELKERIDTIEPEDGQH